MVECRFMHAGKIEWCGAHLPQLRNDLLVVSVNISLSGDGAKQDDNSILRSPEIWLAALVGCGPAVLIATLMIVSLLQRQTPV